MVKFVEGYGYLFNNGVGGAIVWSVRGYDNYPKLTIQPTINNGRAIVIASEIWVRIK